MLYLSCKVASASLRCLHTFELVSPNGKLTHSCKVTSVLILPHQFWRCFKLLRMTNFAQLCGYIIVVRLRYCCEVASQFWGCIRVVSLPQKLFDGFTIARPLHQLWGYLTCKANILVERMPHNLYSMNRIMPYFSQQQIWWILTIVRMVLETCVYCVHVFSYEQFQSMNNCQIYIFNNIWVGYTLISIRSVVA